MNYDLGKRGLKFHYSVNGEGDIPRTTTTPWWTTSTEPITDENGSTVTFTTTTTTTTTRETTTTQPTGTNPAGYPTAPPRPGQDPSAFPLPDQVWAQDVVLVLLPLKLQTLIIDIKMNMSVALWTNGILRCPKFHPKL